MGNHVLNADCFGIVKLPLSVLIAMQMTHWHLPMMQGQQHQVADYIPQPAYVSPSRGSPPSTPQPYVPVAPFEPVEPAKPSVMEIELGPDQFGGDVIEVCVYCARSSLAERRMSSKTHALDRDEFMHIVPVSSYLRVVSAVWIFLCEKSCIQLG